MSETEDDLAPCAGTMAVALARASLKHLSSRDGSNLCSEDLTLGLTVPADDQLSVALTEIAAPEHPLATRLFGGLTMLSRALDPQCFTALTDPQVLCAFKLGARALALCELMREPKEASEDLFAIPGMDADGNFEIDCNGRAAEGAGEDARTEFTGDELAVIECTLRCYMCICLCALGAWERAHQLSEDIRDGDASPFRDPAAAKMFKVLVAAISHLQSLTVEALARRSGAMVTSAAAAANNTTTGGGATGRSVASNASASGCAGDGSTCGSGSGGGGGAERPMNMSLNADGSIPALNDIMATLGHARKLLGSKNGSPLDTAMLHIAAMAINAAVLTEKTETSVAQLHEQDAAAEREQRRLARRMRLTKDPGEAQGIPAAARDLGAAQDTELRRSVVGLNKLACQLWRVVNDCLLGPQAFLLHDATSTSSKKTHHAAAAAAADDSESQPQPQPQPQPPSAINAGCAVTVAECLRGLLLIRSAPYSDKVLCSVSDLNAPVARSVAAGLGDASPWSLHVRITCALALLRHRDLPPPSPVVAWSISPDVLTSRWRPPAALVSRAQDMAAVARGRLRSAARANVSSARAFDEERGGGDASTGETKEVVVLADLCADITEALMMLDELAIERDRMLTASSPRSSHRRSAKDKSKHSAAHQHYFQDDCEYFGGQTKVGAIVDCLDRLCGGSPDGDDDSGVEMPFPALPDSVVSEARRLRALVSKKVPIADAVAQEQRRARSRSGGSPHGSRHGGSDSNTRKSSPTTGTGGTGGVRGPATNTANNNSRVARKARLAIVPSGGVLKNRSEVRFAVPPHVPADAELLVSVAHGSDGAAARIFKPAALNGKFVVDLGRRAPGWGEVHAILRMPDRRSQARELQEQKRRERQQQKRHRQRQKNSSDDDDHDDEDDENDQVEAVSFSDDAAGAGGADLVDAPQIQGVLAVATARFYVVTHGDSGTTAKHKLARK